MVAVLIGVVGALAGTVVGSLLTQAMQRRNAAHARLHEARIEAYRSFATSVMEYRKALMDRWFIENEGRKVDGHDAYARRSAVWAAYYQVLLVAGDHAIFQLAQDARDLTNSLRNATTKAELDDQSDVGRAAVERFAYAARHEISPVKRTRRRPRASHADT
jgi:hypothetical protein